VAKFLIVVKSQNPMDVNTALNVGQRLKVLGAEDVKIVFLGPGINALSKKSEASQIVLKATDGLKQAGVKVLACEMAMANFNVKKEDLVYYDETAKGAEVILNYANQGYQVLTF
jgi:hypothetical protein